MNRRVLLFFLLSFAVIQLTVWWSTPPVKDPKLAQQAAKADGEDDAAKADADGEAAAGEDAGDEDAAAEKVARRLENRPGTATDAAFARAAFETVLGTAPNAEELAACAEALEEWRALAARAKRPDPATRARANLVHALFNHNDFITVR